MGGPARREPSAAQPSARRLPFLVRASARALAWIVHFLLEDAEDQWHLNPGTTGIPR